MWFVRVAKRVRTSSEPIVFEHKGIKCELVHTYLDPFSGFPMLGVYVDERPFGVLARDVYENESVNLIPDENEISESKKDS